MTNHRVSVRRGPWSWSEPWRTLSAVVVALAIAAQLLAGAVTFGWAVIGWPVAALLLIPLRLGDRLIYRQSRLIYWQKRKVEALERELDRCELDGRTR